MASERPTSALTDREVAALAKLFGAVAGNGHLGVDVAKAVAAKVARDAR